MRGHKLYYFTHSFPFGFGETWKSNELDVFRDYFDDIVIVPYCHGGNPTSPQPVAPSVQVTAPLFPDADAPAAPRRLSSVSLREVRYFGRELFATRAFLSRRNIEKWRTASSRIYDLRRHPTMTRLIEESDASTTWYFYWGRGSCDIIPFLSRARVGKTIVRMHGYDLFEYRNDGYIPYRRPLLDSADLIAPSSQAGLAHLKQHHPNAKAAIAVQRCGTVGHGRARASADGVLRIVSCSSLIPLKRVEIVIDALRLTRIPVEWTHLGDGVLMHQCRRLAESLPSNVRCRFAGHVTPRDVLPFFVSNPIDLFVNVSSTEGLPFSVMEAFSAGIPVLATDVGGTAEIVDHTVGRILPETVTPELLSGAFCEFHERTPAQKQQLRDAAYRRYSTSCDARMLTANMARTLVGLS